MQREPLCFADLGMVDMYLCLVGRSGEKVSGVALPFISVVDLFQWGGGGYLQADFFLHFTQDCLIR